MQRISGWLHTHPLVVDTVLAAGLVAIVYSWVRNGTDIAVAVAAALPLVVRRRYPMPAAIAVALVGAVALVVMAAPIVVLPAVLVAVYSAAAYGPRWSGPLAVVVTAAGVGLETVVIGVAAEPLAPGVVAVMIGFGISFTLTAWLAGSLRRARRISLEQLQERARMLEVEREQESHLAALAERARIAREMHDIVAHSLSVIVVQADGGRYVAADNPAAAAEALTGIAAIGREALADVRGLLGMLRADEGGAAADGPGPQPDPSLIPGLVEEIRAAGTPVRLTVTGEARDLPAAAGLAAYRVVQEALTNVLKHAGAGAEAHVELEWRRDDLTVRVTDDGVGPAVDDDRRGRGLQGMRERAALHGGHLEAGPRPGGGFAVHAVLPYAPRS
ncbi:two-component sensor histidine kinase [Pseudonocardia sp. MH-G8]|nr:two-component sensor histidine kinase [Pseudonocardia sp. MH-G8]